MILSCFFIFHQIFSQSDGSKPILVVLNLSKDWKTIDLTSEYDVPEKLKVVTASIQSQYKDG